MLTGERIKAMNGYMLNIEPFNEDQCQPNSYDLRLGDELHVVLANSKNIIDTHFPSKTEKVEFFNFNRSWLLEPNQLYLGHSVEVLWSDNMAPILHGRSTAARHGLMVHLCAGFCDVGWHGQIVFEIVNLTPYPMLVYAGDRIAQVSFEPVVGTIKPYRSTYNNQRGIVGAKSLED